MSPHLPYWTSGHLVQGPVSEQQGPHWRRQRPHCLSHFLFRHVTCRPLAQFLPQKPREQRKVRSECHSWVWGLSPKLSRGLKPHILKMHVNFTSCSTHARFLVKNALNGLLAKYLITPFLCPGVESSLPHPESFALVVLWLLCARDPAPASLKWRHLIPWAKLVARLHSQTWGQRSARREDQSPGIGCRKWPEFHAQEQAGESSS